MVTAQNCEHQTVLLTTKLGTRPGDGCCEMVLLSYHRSIYQYTISSSVPWSSLFEYIYANLAAIADCFRPSSIVVAHK